MNYIREIAEALSENHAALMVGAGFSKNAEKVSITDKKFLNWNELSDLFYETVYGKEGPAHPEVLLLNEPFSALDAQTRIKLQSGLLDAWEQEKNYKEVAKLVNLLHENCFHLG